MVSNMTQQIFMDSHSQEINTDKIMDTMKMIMQYSLTIIVELSNYSFYFLVFLSLLSYLISLDKSIIELSMKYLPVEETRNKERVNILLRSIKGVFLSPLKISVTLSTVSWVILDFFGVKYLYLYSFMAAVIPFIPLFSVSILGIPAAFYLYFSGANYLWAISCFFVYYFVTSRIYTEIYSHELSNINPFFLFLSLVNGLYVFDLKGFLYGPILICLIHAVIDILKPPQKSSEVKVKQS